MAQSSPIDDFLLEVRSLNKRYDGGIWANRDIDLTVEPGEIIGILGPNGAGKTTLVRQITTELLPTSGEIKVLGYDVVREPLHVKAQLGIVPQEATPFDYLTVHQHLRIFAKLRGLRRGDARRRSDEIINDLRLEDYRDTAVQKISGGMRRRLLVGIAALAQPPLLILDEPTTGLDPESRRNLWSLLRQYREAGNSVLLTTHYMEEAEALCDRVGIIVGGRLLDIDTVDNLRASHGFEFKVTYQPNGLGEPVTLYGSDDQELVQQVQSMGLRHFSVGKTTLEDVFLAMTGDHEKLNDGAN